MQHKTIIGETVEIKSFGEIYRKLLTTSLTINSIQKCSQEIFGFCLIDKRQTNTFFLLTCLKHYKMSDLELSLENRTTKVIINTDAIIEMYIMSTRRASLGRKTI